MAITTKDIAMFCNVEKNSILIIAYEPKQINLKVNEKPIPQCILFFVYHMWMVNFRTKYLYTYIIKTDSKLHKNIRICICGRVCVWLLTYRYVYVNAQTRLCGYMYVYMCYIA